MQTPSPLSTLAGSAAFSGSGASVAALLLLRLTGLLWIAPMFSSRSIPMSIRTAVLVVMTILLWPVAVAMPGAASAHVTASTMTTELLVGLTLGLGAAVFIGAAEATGDMLAVQMGLSGANVVDPMSETQLPVLGQFLGLFVTVLILSSDGHVMILSALRGSLEVVAPGGSVDPSGGAFAVIRLGSTLLLLGLRFAAPVIAAMMIGNVTLGILARTVPQLNVLMAAFPIQIALGLFTLAVSLPLIASGFGAWPDQYGTLVERILRSLVPQGAH